MVFLNGLLMIRQFFLEPNNTCIIPKNVYHEVINKNENKLSLTINLE